MGDGVPARASARITLVEEHADLRSVVAEILRLAGYEVTALSGDGLAAGGIAETRPQIVVLDLGLQGRGQDASWQQLQELRSDPRLEQVPLLVCSADLAALRSHAEDFKSEPLLATLEIPFGVEELEDAVARLLDRRPAPLWDDGELVLVADEDSRLLDASSAVLRLLGLRARELPSLQVADIVAHEVEWTEAEWKRYRADGHWQGSVMLQAADGRRIAASSAAEIVRRDGRTWHVSRLSLPEADQAAASAMTDGLATPEGATSP
jgi:CheY-like chemotaxis protein